MATSKITLFNPSIVPVVYTDDGRIVAGGERVELDKLDESGQRAVDRGRLVNETKDDEPTGEAAPADSEKESQPKRRARSGESAEAKAD